MAPKKNKKTRTTCGPLKLLIDTSVWFDLAKDYRQLTLLSALEELVHAGRVHLIVPQIVKDEFARNKSRIADESGRSLSGVFRRVKEAVDRFAPPETKTATLAALSDIDHRIGTLGEAVNQAIERIEALLAATQAVPTTAAVKVRAADRAIQKRAPFHRQRNGIDDAILIETYAAMIAAEQIVDAHFAFVTHNTKDFSSPTGDNRVPHPDIADCFTARSTYRINLGDLLKEVAPDLLEDLSFEREWVEEPRRLGEITDAIGELLDKVWYNRHWNTRVEIQEGKVKLVEKETLPVKDHATRPIQRDVWEGALKSAKRVEKQYGLDNLGPWTDFEWGMLNGKLSALRWALGDEWDMLDT